MNQTVSLTSQGQISIPSKMRKKLNLNAPGKVKLSIDKNRLVIEPIVDILKLGGAFENKGFKNKSLQQVMASEKHAIEEMYITRPHIVK